MRFPLASADVRVKVGEVFLLRVLAGKANQEIEQKMSVLEERNHSLQTELEKAVLKSTPPVISTADPQVATILQRERTAKLEEKAMYLVSFLIFVVAGSNPTVPNAAFYRANQFIQPIGDWDVSRVTTLSGSETLSHITGRH